MLNQKVDDAPTSPACGIGQWGVAVGVSRVRISPSLQQFADDGEVGVARAYNQWGVPLRVSGVDVGLSGEQLADDLKIVADLDRDEQNGLVRPRSDVGILALCQQLFDRSRIALQRG